MASIRTLRSGAVLRCVRNKLLPKPLWATFDTYEQAEQYGSQLERLLAQGIVPASLLEQGPLKRISWTISRCIAEYVRHNAVPVSDVRLLDMIRPAIGFRTAFAQAGLREFYFHDLRHEATCRLYQRTSLSDALIAKITGHRDIRMLRRYASLRGSDLAGHLW